MKKVISIFLVFALMIGVMPLSVIITNSKYYTVDEMTEAEAFAAGLDVYMAWYNYRDSYGDIVTNPITAIYKDKLSAFNQLYAQVYPEGASSKKGQKVLREAESWLEDHYDGIDQFSAVEDEIMMSLLLACVLYTGLSEGDTNNDVTEAEEAMADFAMLGYNISNFQWMEDLTQKSLFFSKNYSPLEWLADMSEEFDIGDYSFGIISSIITKELTSEIDRKNAIATAAKYDTIKNVTASDIDILREYETYGFIGPYIKKYTEAYDSLWSTGESSFEELLLENSNNYSDIFIDIGVTSIKGASSAVVAQYGASTLGLGAGLLSNVLLGFEAFNVLEGVWKFSGDALFGQTAIKTADLTLFYLDWIRNIFYSGYLDAYTDFGNYQTPENAKRLNTYSRLMYRIFAASEMYASQLNNSYATAGLLNVEWMHFIPGGIDPKLTAIAEKQSKNLLQLRNMYLSNACKAYSSFCEYSLYTIELNLMGGTYPIAQELGLGNNIIKWGKIRSIDTSIPEGIPVRNGYVFGGWTTDYKALSADPTYAPGSSYSKNHSLTLYAVWKKCENITYNPNGGTGAPASHENTMGNTTLSATVPTRTGHTFLGWSENATATTATYQPGGILTKEGNVTLYAVWKAGVFDIVFHANGGEFSDNSDSKTLQKTYLKNFTVSPEVPTRDGYTFSGYWTLNADGSGTAYKQGNTYSDIGGAGLSAKHLYAQWSKAYAEFRYDYSNCSDYDDLALSLDNGVLSVKLVDPPQNIIDKFAADGKRFVKWMYIKPDGSIEYYKSGETLTIANPAEPRECVYAIWEVASSGVLLSVIADKTSYLPGDTVTLTITADNSGFFTVDASDNNGFKIKCANGSKASSGVFVEKSSSSSSSTLKCYDNGSAYTVIVYIPNSCRDGSYTVEIVASDGTYGVSGTETSRVTEEITINVASYEEEADSYTLLYHPNGGYGTVPDAERFKEGDKVKLIAPSGLKREGYTFSHWTTDEDGDGKTYKAGKSYQFTEDVTLYAQWKVDPNADIPKELEVYLTTDRYDSTTGVSWYKAGDIIGLRVDIDNSNHFYVDARNCPNFTFTNAYGSKATEGTFYEKSSPNYDGTQTTYKNGSAIYISIKIPNNCKDGEYTIFVTGADSVVDMSTGSSYGKKLKVGITITVRKSEAPDEVHLNKSEITIHAGDRKRLTAAINPEFVSEGYYAGAMHRQYITWESSNSNVVSTNKTTGSSVYVTGEKTGTATITATFNGISASCKVTVIKCSYTVKDPQNDYLASAATCASQATYYYVCECGEVGTDIYKYGDVVAHNYSAWGTVQQPSATTAGVEQRTCSGCQNTEERSIPATGVHTIHTPGTLWHSDSEKHWQVCSVDGCTMKLNENAHSFGDLSVETPATETNAGIGYRTCTCGYTKSEEILTLAHAHNWDTAYSRNETHHWHDCIGCEEKDDIIAHLWGSGVVTQPATVTSTGIMSYTCAFCYCVKEEVIPKIEPAISDINYDGIIDEADAQSILQYITGHEVNVNESVLDVNSDDEINIRDAATILLYLNGKID